MKKCIPNKSVLIVTPYFAPQSHAAVFRAYKLAKHLPQYGWKPYVLTTDTNYLYNEDPSLLTALPPEVEIVRARYIEPTLRGLRMALGGDDRSFKILKHANNGSIGTVSTNSHQKQSGLTTQMYRYLLDSWIQVPDAYWSWYRPAVNTAKLLIQKHKIPIVLTSTAPYTCHHIGYALKKAGCAWVADFRDPLTHCYRMHSQYGRVFLKQKSAEKLAVFHADIITTLAESYRLILNETYGLNDKHPIHFITTGLDSSLLSKKKTYNLRSFPYLIFVGEYLPSYSPRFFKIFKECLNNEAVAKTGIKILFIGRHEINQERTKKIIQEFQLQERVEFIDHLPQQELYYYIQSALGTLLVPGIRSQWWNLYAKLVDYIALRKPVIAIVPDPSEARTHLTRTGLGIFLDGNDKCCATQLSNFLLNPACHLNINESECDRFLASRQVGDFAQVFETLL